MALQRSLAVLPRGAPIVGPRLARVRDDQFLVAYRAADPMSACAVDNPDGMRLAAGMLSHVELAPDTAVAKALGVRRQTVRRNPHAGLVTWR